MNNHNESRQAPKFISYQFRLICYTCICVYFVFECNLNSFGGKRNNEMWLTENPES